MPFFGDLPSVVLYFTKGRSFSLGKKVSDLVVDLSVISLEGKNVIATFIHDSFSDVCLAAHGIYGDCRAF